MLQRLLKVQLYTKLSKCEFRQEQLDYLGYRISSRGVEMDPAKVKDVLGWEAPRTWRQLQSFLEFANFYRQFIPNFAQVALPLTDLLKTRGSSKTPKPSTPLAWTPECQEAFGDLKRRFTAEPILRHPNLDQRFIIQVDASDVVTGAVLL
ncbi:uncharacterized protein LOC107326661 [Python bivittatus]|uniref:Uncharacterized protein LOC107326661 n=1 Tax=Python bivittatus TaxID=176946 RepID=A0A9F3QUM7_PYTBI|nr:uncharacterized protein LOC107326661 [Python bivittatus]